MGTVCTTHRRDRRERQRIDRQTICAIESSDRRKVARVCEDGVNMCQHYPVLLPLGEETQPRQTWDCTTTFGMDRAERRDSTSTSEISDTVYGPAMFYSVQPPESRRRSLVQRMSAVSIRQTVTFDKHITVFRLNDWSPEIYRAARKGLWMQLAVDRHRFKRRIQQTELVLGNIFTDSHRDKMWFYVNNKLCA